jgi:hypothetical protein
MTIDAGLVVALVGLILIFGVIAIGMPRGDEYLREHRAVHKLPAEGGEDA